VPRAAQRGVRRHKKMRHIRLFQTLVVISTLSYVLWFFFPHISQWFANDLYRDVASRLGQYDGLGALLPIHHPLYYVPWFTFWLIASIGLFFFQNWARYLFLFLYVLSLALAPFSGFSVKGPLESFFGEITAVLDGAILAMAYLSPLSAAFTRSPNPPLNRTRADDARAG
jgi:hypothetical protein